MKYYFIDTKNKKTTMGLIEDNKIEFLKRFKGFALRDDIFIAKIIKELPSIKGYIIEIEKDVKGCIETKYLSKNIKLGDEVLVQLYKKTSDDKLDKYTTNYSISGRNLVYYPLRDKNVFSKKISKSIVEDFLCKNDLSTFRGITFRTDSIKKDKNELEEEYLSLKRLNLFILKQSKFLPIPRRIYSNIKFIYEQINEEFDYIITNDIEKYKGLKDYFKDKNIIYDESYDYEYDEKITDDLLTFKSKKVFINESSNIVIEKTEALTVIDVNSGRNIDILSINKQAVKEGLRQLEFREITGIAIIDIISMKKNELQKLFEFINNEIKKYTRIRFLGISNTGLLEFIRTGISVDN